MFFLSVAFLITALVVFFCLGRPILFSQLRPGLNGKPFKMFKFRSMLEGKDVNGVSLPDSKRLTTAGKFLRSSSLDELPGLWNVLKGDMSLIGPRPDYYEHALLFLDNIPHYRLRHAIRPGISGLSQIRLGYVEGLNATRKKSKIDIMSILYKNAQIHRY